MGLPELIRLFYADSFLIFGVSIKFGHNRGQHKKSVLSHRRSGAQAAAGRRKRADRVLLIVWKRILKRKSRSRNGARDKRLYSASLW